MPAAVPEPIEFRTPVTNPSKSRLTKETFEIADCRREDRPMSAKELLNNVMFVLYAMSFIALGLAIYVSS